MMESIKRRIGDPMKSYTPPAIKEGAKIAAFKRGKVFKGLTAGQIKRIASTSTLLRVPKGSYLFYDGDPAEKFYIVHSGYVKLYKISASGRILNFFFATTGDTLNASAVSIENYFMSAQAMTDVIVAAVPKSRYLAFVADHASVAMEIISAIARRLSLEQQRTVDLAGEAVETRIIKSLFELASRLGNTLLLTREELASFVGTTTETAIRVLSHLKKQGIIADNAGKGEIVIADMKKLARSARGL